MSEQIVRTQHEDLVWFLGVLAKENGSKAFIKQEAERLLAVFSDGGPGQPTNLRLRCSVASSVPPGSHV